MNELIIKISAKKISAFKINITFRFILNNAKEKFWNEINPEGVTCHI